MWSASVGAGLRDPLISERESVGHGETVCTCYILYIHVPHCSSIGSCFSQPEALVMPTYTYLSEHYIHVCRTCPSW